MYALLTVGQDGFAGRRTDADLSSSDTSVHLKDGLDLGNVVWLSSRADISKQSDARYTRCKHSGR